MAAGKRSAPGDAEFASSFYIAHPDQLQCTLALDDTGAVLGFQSLKLAKPGNPYDTPVGWGIIGTHIRPDAARRGVGAQLFKETLLVAKNFALPAIEAVIQKANAEGRAYYRAMGFETYRKTADEVCKRYLLA